MNQIKSDFLHYLNWQGSGSSKKKKESDPLKVFYTTLLYQSSTVAFHHSAKFGVEISAEHVRHAALTLGFELSSVMMDDLTPPEDFCLMTDTILKQGKFPRDTVQSEALELLYGIYQLLGSVLVTDVPSGIDSEETIENLPSQHYALSSPVGVQAQFSRRDPEFDPMDDEYIEEDEDDDEAAMADDEEDVVKSKLMVEDDDTLVEVDAINEDDIVDEDDEDLMDFNVV